MWCFVFFFNIVDELNVMMAGAHSKDSEELTNLLTKVIAIRRELPKEYEFKLRKSYTDRANQMRNGVFHGKKLPDIKLENDALKENLKKNRDLMEKAQYNADQYFFVKDVSQQLNDELKDMVVALQKVTEIEKTMRN